MNRRKFIAMASAGAAGAGLLATGVAAETKNKPGAPMLKKGGLDKIKIGLYDISYGGNYYLGDALSFEETAKRAKKYGYAGLELDNKRPMSNPMDLNPRRRDEMRMIASDLGLEIPCIAANNDFTSPIPEQRECQLLMVRETVRLARDLGAKIVRIHAAWPGLPIHEGVGTYDFIRPDTKNGLDAYTFQGQYPYCTYFDRWRFAQDCVAETAKFAEEFGVVVALQNHGPLIRCWKDVYDMVTVVNSPWLKICLDLPIMEKFTDKEYVANAVRTVGALLVHSHYGGEYFRDTDGQVKAKTVKLFDDKLPDYAYYLDLLADIGYQGYFAYELCHPLVKFDRSFQGIEYAHEQVELAQKYIHAMLTR
jgi:sugar phosphate isomerase/epimerase